MEGGKPPRDCKQSLRPYLATKKPEDCPRAGGYLVIAY